MSQEPFLIILETFGKNRNFPKNVDFVRVCFQFLARVHAARKLLVRSTFLLAALKLFSSVFGPTIDVSDVGSESFSEAQNPSF